MQDSKNLAGITIEFKFQGLFQGSGAAPEGRAVINITIICAQQSKRHGGHFVCPISNLTGHLLALLFLNYTGLIHIDIKGEETVTVAYQAMKDIISN